MTVTLVATVEGNGAGFESLEAEVEAAGVDPAFGATHVALLYVLVGTAPE